MRIKPDWIKNLHEMKDKEIARAFKGCSENIFKDGLELGAGDGYQSNLLAKYMNKLISTDYNIDRIKKEDSDKITYIKCDADKINECFDEKKFDIVFSSNVLEHLKEPEAALKGIKNILNDDGVMVHCLPNIFWKFSQITLYYLNIIVILIEKMFEPGWIKEKIQAKENMLNKTYQQDNNPKSAKKRRILFPPVHGMSSSHLHEFRTFLRSSWEKQFRNSGFRIIKMIRGPVSSGYGFGFRSLKAILENIGVSSVDIYVLEKEGYQSKFRGIF